MGSFLAVIVVFGFCISYTVNYKKTICDTSVSPDEKYELTLQAVGEPDWPFGSASGRLILMEGQDKISQTDFELHNDGGSITSNCWKVTWYEDYVEVILSGEEQFDEQVILYFDGTKDIQQLTDIAVDYIFAYNVSTKDVVSSGKTSWSATGNEKYYEVTGKINEIG